MVGRATRRGRRRFIGAGDCCRVRLSAMPSRSPPPSSAAITVSVEDRKPAEIAAHAEAFYAKKTDVSASQLFLLAILAGIYIAFGSMFSLVVLAGAEGAAPFGLVQLLAGVAFSLGLILVVVGGAELFTGNTLMVIPRAAERATGAEVARAWAVVYAGNFLGSVVTVGLFVLASGHTLGDSQVGLAALQTADRKSGLTLTEALSSGVLANMLVCLAVWLALSARTTGGKILAIIAPIAAFVAAGLEHSVANMSLIPLGLLVQTWAAADFWSELPVDAAAFPNLSLAGFGWNLLWATIGNIIGGAAIGFAYWFAYRRGK
jgi:formate transporter